MNADFSSCGLAVTRIAGALGAEVRGLDLREPLDDARPSIERRLAK